MLLKKTNAIRKIFGNIWRCVGLNFALRVIRCRQLLRFCFGQTYVCSLEGCFFENPLLCVEKLRVRCMYFYKIYRVQTSRFYYWR